MEVDDGLVAGTDSLSYFEKHFPDLTSMEASAGNPSCAEWLLTITTKVGGFVSLGKVLSHKARGP